MISYSSGVYFYKITQVSSPKTFNFMWKKVAFRTSSHLHYRGFSQMEQKSSLWFQKKKKITLSRWGKIRWTFPAIGKSNKETGSQRWKIKMAILRSVADIILLMGYIWEAKGLHCFKIKITQRHQNMWTYYFAKLFLTKCFYQNL